MSDLGRIVPLLALLARRSFETLWGWTRRVSSLRHDFNTTNGWPGVRLGRGRIPDAVLRAQEASARYETLNAINQRINSEICLELVIPEIIRSAVELIGGTAGEVFLCDRDGVCHGSFVHNLPLRNLSTFQSTIANKIIRGREPVVIEDYTRYERRTRPLDAHCPRCTVGVPMISHGQLFGALVVMTHDPSKRFGRAEIQLLSSFGNQAAIAIRNASLFSENLQRLEESRRAKRALATRTSELRRLLSKTLQSQDETRRRIAADIHDGITQLVIGALCQIQSVTPALRHDLPNSQEVVAKRIELAQSLLKQSIAEMYSVIHGLRPPCLDELGLIVALKKYVEDFRELSGLECRLEVTGLERGIEPDKQIVIYRVVQEALTNVGKHAQACRAAVHVRFFDDKVVVTIDDDGRGFKKDTIWRKSGRHLGVCDMEARAHSVGGSLEIRSSHRSGTQVLLDLPSTTALEAPGDPLEEADLRADELAYFDRNEAGSRPGRAAV